MCFMCCRFRQDVLCWQWDFGGLGSGTRIQFFGDWVKDKLLGIG